MKKIRKMDERELMMSLKACRICYTVLSLSVFICWFLSTFEIVNDKNGILLSVITLIDAITYVIALFIYNPDKKIKNEK